MTMKKVFAGATIALAATALSTTAAVAQEDGCVTSASPESLAGRASPLDSISFNVRGQSVKVCYGRPSARGRQMIGGNAVPYGRLWRTGANEPTMIHTPVALSIAGVQVGPGTYSLYTVPNESEWEVIVNRSYSQWGHEGRYTAEVEAQEVGRGSASASFDTGGHTETFTITHRGNNLVFSWEHTTVTIPVSGG